MYDVFFGDTHPLMAVVSILVLVGAAWEIWSTHKKGWQGHQRYKESLAEYRASFDTDAEFRAAKKRLNL